MRLVNLWRRTFSEPDLRPSPWPARKDKLTHPLLLLTGELARSPRVSAFTAGSVTMSSDRKYAAIHQFGGSVKTKYSGYRFDREEKPKQSYFNIPARPHFPMMEDGRLTPRAEEIVEKTVYRFIDENAKRIGRALDHEAWLDEHGPE